MAARPNRDVIVPIGPHVPGARRGDAHLKAAAPGHGRARDNRSGGPGEELPIVDGKEPWRRAAGGVDTLEAAVGDQILAEGRVEREETGPDGHPSRRRRRRGGESERHHHRLAGLNLGGVDRIGLDQKVRAPVHSGGDKAQPRRVQ